MENKASRLKGVVHSHLSNASQDYELNFGLWEKHVDNAWHGGVATIEHCPGSEVWGVIWTLSNEDLTSLDK